jgi:DNA-directed RNA polymerase specialized sigma24 family protein
MVVVQDAELYARWIRGDRSAGDTLVTKHHVALIRWVSARASKQARDIVQTTWLIAQGSGTYTGRGSFGGWLRAIARSQMKAERRACSLTPASMTGVSWAVLRMQLIAAINDLSNDDQREVAKLVWIFGLSPRDISLRTGVKLETVRSRIRLARTKLRAYFGTTS